MSKWPTSSQISFFLAQTSTKILVRVTSLANSRTSNISRLFAGLGIWPGFGYSAVLAWPVGSVGLCCVGLAWNVIISYSDGAIALLQITTRWCSDWSVQELLEPYLFGHSGQYKLMQFRRLVLVHKPLFYIQILPVQDKKKFLSCTGRIWM